MDYSASEQTRKKNLKDFESGDVGLLVVGSEISTRREFELSRPVSVLINIDFPMTLQLYLYRISKRAIGGTQVYTFFMPHYDIRHTVPLVLVLEETGHKVSPALQRLKEHIKTNDAKNERGGGRRPQKSTPSHGESTPDTENYWEDTQHESRDDGNEGGRVKHRERARQSGAWRERLREEYPRDDASSSTQRRQGDFEVDQEAPLESQEIWYARKGRANRPDMRTCRETDERNSPGHWQNSHTDDRVERCFEHEWSGGHRADGKSLPNGPSGKYVSSNDFAVCTDKPRKGGAHASTSSHVGPSSRGSTEKGTARQRRG